MTLAGLQIENPFPGLRPYEQDQSDLFFGRDEQVDELLDRIEARRFVAVIGTSGSGKSSLVRAGLVPALHRGLVSGAGATWRTIVIRPGSEPIKELAGGLAHEFGIPPEVSLAACDRSSMGLAEFACQDLSTGQNLLLVVDQFEEIFRYSRTTAASETTGDEAAAFVKLLLSAVGRSDVPVPGLADLPVYIVLTMRSDFLGKCSQFRGLPEALNDSQYLVPRMTREQLLESIEGPIGMAGARIAPRLSQRLLNDAGENPDLLPVLQHLLMRLWEESRDARERGEEIDLPHYEHVSVGGMSKALNLDANHAYDTVATDERRKWMVRRIFQRLVEPGAKNEETRRPTPLSEVAAVCEAPESEIETLIHPFRERGFLTTSQDRDPMVDITHESLIRLWDRLGKWVANEVESASIYKRLADSAVKKLALYRDPELTQARRWREKTWPNRVWAARYSDAHTFDEAMDFLNRSQKAQEWRVWRRIGAVAALGLLTIAMALLAIMTKRALRAEREESNRAKVAEKLKDSAVLQHLQDAQMRAAGAAELRYELTREQGMLQEVNAAKTREQEATKVARVGELTADAALLVRESASNAPLSALLALTSRSRGPTPANLQMLQDLMTILPKEVKRLPSRKRVWTVAYSPDGKLMATGSDDGTVHVFDAHSWNQIQSKQYDGGIAAVAFSPDSQQLVEGGGDHSARVLNARTGALISTFSTDDIVLAAAFSPDGRFVTLANNKNKILAFPLQGGEAPGFAVPDEVHVDRIAFSPNGHWLAAAAGDGKYLYIFDVDSRRLVYTLEQPWARDVAFSPDSQYLAVSRNDSTVRILSFSDIKQETDLPKEVSRFELESPANAVSFSSDGHLVATGSNGNAAIVFEALTGIQVAQFSSDGEVNAVAFHPSGNFIAIGSEDNTTRVFETHGGGLQMTDFANQGAVHDIEFSTDLKLGVLSSDDHTATIFEVPTGKKLISLNEGNRHVNTSTFSHDKRWVVVGNDGGGLDLYRVSDGTRIWEIQEPGLIDDAQFSWNDRYIATGSDDKTVRLMDAATGKEIWKNTLGDTVNQVAFSRDSKYLACADTDKTARVYAVDKGKELASIAHTAPVLRIAFSPDGMRMATGTNDKILRVFDGTTGKDIADFPEDSIISDIAYSPDGRYIAVSTFGRTVHVIDIEKKTEVFHARLPHRVYTVQFSSDGRTLLSAGPFEANANSLNAAPYRAWFYMQPVLSGDLMDQACSLLTENLTSSQWKQYVGNEPYQKTCQNLPIPQETAAAK